MTTQANGGQNGGGAGGDGGTGNGNADGGNNNQNGNGSGDQNQNANNSQNGGQQNGGSDNNQNGNGNQEQLTEAQLNAAFQHPRFKELSQQAQELKTLKQKQADDEAERLKQQGEHEKLAEQYKGQAETAQQQLNTERTNNALVLAASKLGAHDPSSIAKLVDSGKISIDDNGVVTGADDAVKALQTSSPYLFKTGSGSSIGGGDTNSQGGGGGATDFTYSQFKDSAFYAKNSEAMDKALKEGKVDMTR